MDGWMDGCSIDCFKCARNHVTLACFSVIHLFSLLAPETVCLMFLYTPPPGAVRIYKKLQVWQILRNQWSYLAGDDYYYYEYYGKFPMMNFDQWAKHRYALRTTEVVVKATLCCLNMKTTREIRKEDARCADNISVFFPLASFGSALKVNVAQQWQNKCSCWWHWPLQSHWRVLTYSTISLQWQMHVQFGELLKNCLKNEWKWWIQTVLTLGLQSASSDNFTIHATIILVSYFLQIHRSLHLFNILIIHWYLWRRSSWERYVSVSFLIQM